MATIIIFNEGNGRVLERRESAHTPAFEGRSDVLIDPVLPGSGTPDRWVVDGDPLAVREMTAQEIATVEAAEEEAKPHRHHILKAWGELTVTQRRRLRPTKLGIVDALDEDRPADALDIAQNPYALASPTAPESAFLQLVITRLS